jgi:hypothetical protein
MSKDATATTDSDMAAWVHPVLVTGADAAAAGDMELADAAAAVLARCGRSGGGSRAAGGSGGGMQRRRGNQPAGGGGGGVLLNGWTAG